MLQIPWLLIRNRVDEYVKVPAALVSFCMNFHLHGKVSITDLVEFKSSRKLIYRQNRQV